MAKKRKNGEGTYGEKIIHGTKYKYFRDPDGKYIYAKTAKELNEKIKQKEEKEATLNIRTSNLCTFSEYCSLWLKQKFEDITNGTYDAYEQTIRTRITEYKPYNIADKQIKSLTEDMFNDYFRTMASKYSRATIDKTWTVVRQVLAYGIDEGDIPRLNLEKIKLPKEEKVAVKKREVKFITEQDMERLFAESNRMTSTNVPLYGNAAKVLVFIMYSGLRLGEAIGLTWRNVAEDFSSIQVRKSTRKIVVRDENLEPEYNDDGTLKYKTIQKETKTENGKRTVPLPERSIEVLHFFYDNYPHGQNDFVFKTKNNTQFDKRGIERCLDRMLERSDCVCKEYSPHSLRHGYGSLLISKGVDIKIVSELLGHSDVAFTYNVYIGILKSDKIKAVTDVFNQKVKKGD